MTTDEKIEALIGLASHPGQLQDVQHVAAKKLLDTTGIVYPHDGCAITLSLLLQRAGFAIQDTYMALDLARNLAHIHNWTVVPVGKQQAGDIGTTCTSVPAPGKDHIYLVLKKLNFDEMVIADNQNPKPHFRWASGKGGKTPTTYFLRAPGVTVDSQTLDPAGAPAGALAAAA